MVRTRGEMQLDSAVSMHGMYPLHVHVKVRVDVDAHAIHDARKLQHVPMRDVRCTHRTRTSRALPTARADACAFVSAGRLVGAHMRASALTSARSRVAPVAARRRSGLHGIGGTARLRDKEQAE